MIPTNMIPSSCLNYTAVKKLICQWLEEDLSSFDFSLAYLSNVSSLTVSSTEVSLNGSNHGNDGLALSASTITSSQNKQVSFVIVCKQKGIVAGQPFINCLFEELQCSITWHLEEGSAVSLIPQKVATVIGLASNLLKGERLALNILSRASGIATTARRLKEKCTHLGWTGTLCATRKTTPGFRLIEKYAAIVGGANCHRYDLSTLVMIKDNHLHLGYCMREVIESARLAAGPFLKIEVECCSKEEALQAAGFGADIVMLDNSDPSTLADIAKQVKSKYPAVLLEASGGITENNLALYFSPYVDIISTSKLCQGYEAIDFSMKVLQVDIAGNDSIFAKLPVGAQKRSASDDSANVTENKIVKTDSSTISVTRTVSSSADKNAVSKPAVAPVVTATAVLQAKRPAGIVQGAALVRPQNRSPGNPVINPNNNQQFRRPAVPAVRPGPPLPGGSLLGMSGGKIVGASMGGMLNIVRSPHAGMMRPPGNTQRVVPIMMSPGMHAPGPPQQRLNGQWPCRFCGISNIAAHSYCRNCHQNR